MIDRARLRVAQTLRYCRPGAADATAWQVLLTPPARIAFATLPNGDQRHAVAVASWLDQQGGTSTLVTAGLLHDIGKAVPGVAVRLPHRVAKVVLAWVAPVRLAQVAAWEAPRWHLDGLWVLSRHARYGGELARQWGYPERVAWLIEHHEDVAATDRELAMLMAIDDGRDIRPAVKAAVHG